MNQNFTNCLINAAQRIMRWAGTPSEADRLVGAVRRVHQTGLRISLHEMTNGGASVALIDADGKIAINSTIDYIEPTFALRAAAALNATAAKAEAQRCIK